MRKSLVLVAIGGVILAPLVACSSDQSNGDDETSNTDGSSSGTTSTAPSSTAPVTGTSSTPTGAGSTTTSNNSTSTGASGSSSTSGGSGSSGGSGTSTSTNTTTSGASGGSSDTSNGGGSSTGGSDSTDSGGETSTDQTTGPVGPPDGAYEACSGAAVPAITLTPYLVSPQVSQPIDMDMPPGQPNMVYVTERTGALKRFDMSQENPTATTVLEVTTSTTLECGFFGVAFHPNFDATTEKRVYVSYTPECATQLFGAAVSALEEYEVSGDTATLTGSVFEYDQPQNNHNGGSVLFGPDGYLYFGLGDGGQSDDQGTGHSANGNGQDVSEPLGSILRFDVDAPGTPPSGNLTADDVGGESVDGRILHFGLRNPWRMSFDRVTGDLYIGDVGQNTREEVDMLPAGSGPTNFGWAVREGTGAHTGGFTLVGGTTAMEPIHDYATSQGGGGGGASNGSVTGGFVYRGQKIPGLYGRYIFADYVRGDIFALTADGQGGSCDLEEIPNNQIAGNSLASFAEGTDGELYAIGLSDGIYRFDPAE